MYLNCVLQLENDTQKKFLETRNRLNKVGKII